MSGSQLPQTRRVILALLQAGYARSEFRVFTPCKRGEYQDTIIIVRSRFERQESLLPRVLATNLLNVTLFVFVKKDGSLFHDYLYEPCRSGRSVYSIANLDSVMSQKES